MNIKMSLVRVCKRRSGLFAGIIRVGTGFLHINWVGAGEKLGSLEEEEEDERG